MTQRTETEPKRVPKFKSEQEAAEFWDSHSPFDYPEEFKEVKVKFDRPLINRGLTVKLSDETLDQIKKIAQVQGVGPSTLVRMWVLEHLREQEGGSARRKSS